MLPPLRSTFEAARLLRPRDLRDIPDIARTLRTTLPYTIVGREHLMLLNRLARSLDREDIPGALVECGVYRGASAGALAAGAPDRDIWLFDSFEGFPPSSSEDPVDVTGTQVGSERDARYILNRLGIDSARSHIEKGWFKETFPEADVGPVALLHVDADLYNSQKGALERFLPDLAPGGYLVLDDYQNERFAGGKHAADETLGQRVRELRMLRTGAGAWMRW
jgi:O-methyltransferase